MTHLPCTTRPLSPCRLEVTLGERADVDRKYPATLIFERKDFPVGGVDEGSTCKRITSPWQVQKTAGTRVWHVIRHLWSCVASQHGLHRLSGIIPLCKFHQRNAGVWHLDMGCKAYVTTGEAKVGAPFIFLFCVRFTFLTYRTLRSDAQAAHRLGAELVHSAQTGTANPRWSRRPSGHVSAKRPVTSLRSLMPCTQRVAYGKAEDII